MGKELVSPTDFHKTRLIILQNKERIEVYLVDASREQMPDLWKISWKQSSKVVGKELVSPSNFTKLG